ncbi:filamentous hemagglutinin [Burkholderia cepacia]|uniref:Filamentous hemagglutinin n=2 Tax=Burkholderia cepacia complex TaxID=87882 RepID=A0A1B4Q2K3_BURCE|nr:MULTISPECIES: filamentous hemagglutinin N-terminal domain-containing protein [Burkholderia cepacia complex]AOK20399.1 filamentous hemagglutinin [Burkholderia cepacia]AOK27175.1 filamentous hemagglutinin [Burkholderia ubonensis]
MNKTYALVWNHAQGCWNAVGETARRRGKAGGSKLVAAGAVSLLGLAALPAHALPTGHAVVAGQADIATSVDGRTMSINQHSDKLITNWQDFGVAGGERVSFHQPDSTSIALNRVIGTHGSQIDGRIDANGKVFLVNPNGVMFGAGSQVNVGSLVASTQNLTDADFLAGNYRFAGTSAATVANAGNITAADGGSVALLGARVSNTGVIHAKMGRIALGAGHAFKVNFDGSDLLSVQVEGGAVDAQASNGGLLKADGGEVLMTARAAGDLLNAVVNNTGTIEARGLSNRGGRITLDGGTVLAGGTLDASATAGQGGEVATRGTHVRIADDATVDTRGANGRSGTWKIDTANARVADDANATIGAASLSRNLGTTHVTLTDTAGDLSIEGPVNWSSDHTLSLASQRGGVKLQRALNARGSRAWLEVNAAKRIDIDGPLALTGVNAALALNSGNGHVLNDNATVTLSGANASFSANGQAYRVIHDVDQLRAVDTNLNGRYVLGNTIKGSGAFRSIGGDAAFTGTFDGLGNTISGLSVYNDGPFVGLFAGNFGTIANLTLDSVSARGTANYGIGPVMVGSLVGANIQGTLSNVHARNVVVTSGGSAANIAGGLVGTNLSGTIDRASVSGRVEGNRYTTALGGLVGENITSPDSRLGTATIARSRADASISIQATSTSPSNGQNGFGGLVGFNSGDIRDSSSHGAVSVATVGATVGGLVGRNTGTVGGSDASGRVTAGTASAAGALVGVNAGAIAASRASGGVAGGARSTVGGLVGINTAVGTIDKSNATGTVAVAGNDATAGGLVGRNDGRVSGSSASGSASVGANGTAGGLVGLNGGRVEYGNASGTVSVLANSDAGGLIGRNTGTVASSHAQGAVSAGADSNAGGLVGNHTHGSIVLSDASGSVNGGARAKVGGLVGVNGGTIDRSSSSGTVSGGLNATLGGIVGMDFGTTQASSTTSRIAYTQGYGQRYGGLAGFAMTSMKGNTASGDAARVPLVGGQFAFF